MKNQYRIQYLFIFLGICMMSACSGKKEETVTEVIRPVKYEKIKRSEDALSETFSGTAQSSIESKLSFKVGGTVNQLNVNVGDQVKRGQTIARIDQTDYSVQYQQSKANLKSVETQIKSAQSQLVNAKATYDRVEKLYENGSVSLSEFEQAKSAYELAQSAFDAAQAQASASERQVESARNQVSYSSLKAPFDGIVTAVFVEVNEMVGSGAPIATVSATHDPEISVGIPELYISRIYKDQPAEVVISALGDQPFDAEVYEVGFSSLGGSTYPVTVRIVDPTFEIRPGMAADVKFSFGEFITPGANKLIAPVAAVGEDGDGHFVFALKEVDDHFIVEKKQITVGRLTPSGFEVMNGLGDNEMVATAGLNMLLDGMKVRLLD